MDTKTGGLRIDTPDLQEYPEDFIPILAVDLWSHSYELDYNKKWNYLSKIWKLIDW